eukprot:scpid95488/ scgid14430/ 
MASPAGRGGKGRGRGVVQLRQPNDAPCEGELRKPSRDRPPEEKPLPPSLKSLVQSAVGEVLLNEKKAEQVASKFNETVTSMEDVQHLADRILELCDSERARALAILCSGFAQNWQSQALVAANPKMAQFRSQLLKAFGIRYEQRTQMKTESLAGFLGFISFLGYLYCKLRISDAPPSFLAEPVAQCLRESLSTKTEVECFLELVEEVGPIMSKHSKSVMDKLCSFCREQLLRDPCPPFKRFALLLVIEQHASQWKMDDEVRSQLDSLMSSVFA